MAEFEGHVITIELSPAKAELILVLNDALYDDRIRDPIIRGWRAADQVISALRYPVEEGSLRRAVSKINRRFREAAAKVAPHAIVPPLLSTKRTIGIRLNWRLDLDVPGARATG